MRPGLIRRTAAAILVFATTASLPALADGPGGLDSSNWIDEIDAGFASVKGYSAVLVNTDGFVIARSGGMANPGQSMSWDHYSNIGSSQKLISALLLLRKMEDKRGRGNLSAINTELDKPVYQFMPTVIQNATPNVNKQITFRHLLQHRSGIFPGDDEHDNPFVDFLQPINAADLGDYHYSNTNFKLLTYLIVAYGAPNILADTNTLVAAQHLGPTDDGIIDKLGYYFEGMMRVQLFDQAPLEVDSSCWLEDTVIDFIGADVAWMYHTKNDSLNSGGWYDQGNVVGHCKAQGGWYYSSHVLARLFRDLGTSDGVISSQLYNMMYDPDGNSSQREASRLGWAHDMASPKLEDVYGWIEVPYSGGDHHAWAGDHWVYAHSAIMRLPGGYHTMAVTNSNEMSSGAIATVLKNAFARSIP